MAADEINAAGGIKAGADTYKLNVIANDDKANPTEATNSVRKLIDRDGVKYLLGFCCSGSTSAVASFIEKENAVMLVGNAAERAITAKGIPNLFRTRPPADFTGAAAGTFVAQAGAQERRRDRLARCRLLHPVRRCLREGAEQGRRQDRRQGNLRPEGPRHDAAADQDPRAQSRCLAGGRLCRARRFRLSSGHRAGHEGAALRLHQRQRGAVPARGDQRADGRRVGPAPDRADRCRRSATNGQGL